MRKAVIFFVALAVLTMVSAAPAYAQVPPKLPHAFYGSVTVNGAPAADGTQVSATVDSETILTTQNPVTTAGGSYGVDSPRLLVQGDIPNGATITFYVDDVEVEGVTATFEAGGGPTEKNLSVTISRPGGGGGGGGGGDTTPPRISNVGNCPEGVTETTADICWKTDEKSTSQLEYWASPTMLSPLDETYVTEHHVKLTGLTPGTTYHYKTMSKDRAGNLAVSDVHTFITLGEAPAFAFTTSNLSISPSECHCGETVTICALITNTGSAAGSCTVTLEINGVVEATEDVTLNAGASEGVTFATAKDVPGSYLVAINGLAGSFTVKEEVAPPPTAPPEAPPEVKPPLNWTLVGGIIAGVVIVGLLIFFLVRRRAV